VALRNALVGQLLLVEPILDDLDSLRVLHSSDGSYVLGGQMTGVATTLAGATTAGAGHLQLDAACAEVRWQARFASEFLAQPARVSALDAGGERVQHGSYESGHRVCWLNLHAALTEGLPLLIPVEQVVRSLAVADVALGR
jgi:hypothetical protein